MAELYGTLGETTLNGSISDSDTSITVTSASAFLGGETYESGGVLRGRLDDGVNVEIIKITNISGSTFTVVRGQEGTSGVAFADLTPLTQVVTAAALDAVRADLVQSGVDSSKPSATQKQGNLYLATDSGVLYRDSGSAIAPMGLYLHQPTIPAVADFSWVNQSSAAATDSAVGIYLSDKENANGIHALVKSAPTAPYVITARFSAPIVWAEGGKYPQVGLCFRENSSGKLHLCASYVTPNGEVRSSLNGEYWTNATSYSGQLYTTSPNVPAFPPWFRIEDNNTNRLYYHSWDGVNWVQMHSEGRTTNFTADQVGFFIRTNSSSTQLVAITLHSWKAT